MLQLLTPAVYPQPAASVPGCACRRDVEDSSPAKAQGSASAPTSRPSESAARVW